MMGTSDLAGETSQFLATQAPLTAAEPTNEIKFKSAQTKRVLLYLPRRMRKDTVVAPALFLILFHT